MVKIGNSRGIIIPKGLLKKMESTEVLDLVETSEGLLLKAIAHPRAGWEEQFKAAGPAEKVDAEWLNASNAFDETEWTW